MTQETTKRASVHSTRKESTQLFFQPERSTRHDDGEGNEKSTIYIQGVTRMKKNLSLVSSYSDGALRKSRANPSFV